MNTKTLILSLPALLAMSAATSHAAYDGKLKLEDSPYQYGQGGEFKATPSAGLEVKVDLSAYSAAVLFGYTAGSFPTFCVEHNENVSFGTTYNVTLNTATVNGGVSGGNPDPISKGTAWLYTQFASGTLANFDYNNDGAENGAYRSGYKLKREGAAGLLQEAIWYLEGELVAPAGANPFVAAAVAAAAAGGYSVTEDNKGMFPVMAMNMYTGLGNLAQDQLVLVPEPGTYVAAALLVLPGLAGLLRVRGKFPRATSTSVTA